MSMTRQRSPFLTQPPRDRPEACGRCWRVMTTSPTEARLPSASGDLAPSTAPSSSSRSARARSFRVRTACGRLGHEDAGLAGAAVGAPGHVRGVEHLVGHALADALLADVGRDDLDLAAAQGEGGVLLPLVDEAMDLGQFRGVGAAVDEEREGAPGFDGLELMGVADEQDLGSRGLRRCR